MVKISLYLPKLQQKQNQVSAFLDHSVHICIYSYKNKQQRKNSATVKTMLNIQSAVSEYRKTQYWVWGLITSLTSLRSLAATTSRSVTASQHKYTQLGDITVKQLDFISPIWIQLYTVSCKCFRQINCSLSINLYLIRMGSACFVDHNVYTQH